MMNYQQAVSELWRHRDLDNAAQDWTNLVRYATLAASSHNTQPWKFQLQSGRISIVPDLERRCPAVDPDDHHLYVSLGCAAENLILAASAAGLRGHCSFDSETSGVEIHLEKAPVSRSPLFEAIPRRQCSRTTYDGSAATREELRLLEGANRENGISVILLTDEQQKKGVVDYVAEGNRAQINDRLWVKELKDWIRFNARDAVAQPETACTEGPWADPMCPDGSAG